MKQFTDLDLVGNKLRRASLEGAVSGNLVGIDVNGFMYPADPSDLGLNDKLSHEILWLNGVYAPLYGSNELPIFDESVETDSYYSDVVPAFVFTFDENENTAALTDFYLPLGTKEFLVPAYIRKANSVKYYRVNEVCANTAELLQSQDLKIYLPRTVEIIGESNFTPTFVTISLLNLFGSTYNSLYLLSPVNYTAAYAEWVSAGSINSFNYTAATSWIPYYFKDARPYKVNVTAANCNYIVTSDTVAQAGKTYYYYNDSYASGISSFADLIVGYDDSMFSEAEVEEGDQLDGLYFEAGSAYIIKPWEHCCGPDTLVQVFNDYSLVLTDVNVYNAFGAIFIQWSETTVINQYNPLHILLIGG